MQVRMYLVSWPGLVSWRLHRRCVRDAGRKPAAASATLPVSLPLRPQRGLEAHRCVHTVRRLPMSASHRATRRPPLDSSKIRLAAAFVRRFAA